MTGWWQRVSAERWAQGVTVLLVLSVGYSAARLTWMLAPGGVAEIGEPVTNRVAPPQTKQTLRLLPLAQLSLFGRVEVADSGPGAMVAPETRLNLVLRGVLAMGYRPGSRAIIAAGAGPETSYKVGDTLPGGATLDQVLPDRVVLRRSGRLETLFLPRDTVAGLGGGTGSPGFGSMPGPRSIPNYPDESFEMGSPMGSAPPGRLQDIRQRILNNPEEAFNLARVQPVMEAGKLKGYRLTPNKEKQLFRQMGLRPGDVVTSVNGITLNDPGTVSQVMSQLSTAHELNLTVDRGGHRETVVVPLGQ